MKKEWFRIKLFDLHPLHVAMARTTRYTAFVFWAVAFPALYIVSRYNYNLFHGLADIFTIVIASTVFVVAWNSRESIDNNYLLYAGIAFLFFAFLDLLHVLGNKNMGVIPQYGNLGPTLYIASRYVLSLSLLIAPLFINRKLKAAPVFAAYSLVTLLVLLSIFYWQNFPVCLVEGVGLTSFKVISDYIIGLILLAALLLLLLNRQSFDARVLRLLAASIFFSIATGLAFTLYADPFGLMNAVGHFFQIISFYLIYLAVIETGLTKPQNILFRKLKESEGRLVGVLESMPDAFVSFDADLRYTYVNANAERLQAARREDLLGKDIQAVYPDPESYKTISLYQRAIRDQEPVTSTSYHAGFDRWVEVRAFPTPDGVSVFYKDVSENVKADKALRESEERVRRIAQAGRIGFVEWNVSKDTAYSSPEHYELLGFKPGSSISWQKWLEGVHPGDRERVMANAARLLERGRAEGQVRDHKDEYRFIRPDGSVVWLESEMSVDMVGGEAVVRGSVRDITTRKQAEEALERTRNLLAETQRIAHLGSFEYVAATQTTVWSEEEYRIYGLDLAGPSPAYDVMLARCIHPDDAALLHNTFTKAMESDSIYELEHRIVRPDGSVRWVYDLAHPYFDKNGNLLRYVGATLDITDRKQAEEALRESERRFRLALRNAPVSVAVQDRELRYIWAYNQKTSHPEQILGHTDEEIFTVEEAARLKEIKTRVLEENVEIREQMWFNRPSGRIFLDVCWEPIQDETGRVTGIGMATVDLTPLKLAEKELKKAHDELEIQVQERTADLAQAVERLRIENIERKHLEDTLRDSERQVRFFASQNLKAQEDERRRIAGELHDSVVASLAAVKLGIEKETEKMRQGRVTPESLQAIPPKLSGVIDEIRRIMADLRPAILDDLGLVAALNWFCREYQKTYPHISIEHRIRLLEVPDPLGTPIFRITQEALNNIAKYSRASQVNLSLGKENGKIRLTLQDNGLGFDRETVKKGLGLSTMRERTELSGGSFDLQSAMGKGTTVLAEWTI